MTQTRKPLLVISYFSVTILWSIFLVIKETHKFPRIVFLPDSNVRADLPPSLSRTLNLSLTYLLKLVLPALRLPPPSQLTFSAYSSICDILLNNFSFKNRSIIDTISYQPKVDQIDFLSRYYSLGLTLDTSHGIRDIYIFNGRYAPQYSFVLGCRDAGLNVFHIEVTRDKSSTFVYACSSSLWHPNRVVELFEKYYDPQYDYLKFYNQRSCGLDPEGLRFKRNQKSSLRFDIIYYTSTPYEFIGFGLDATSYLNITKRIFDELIYFSSQGYRVAIREHPNFITSSQLDQDYYSDLCNKARDAGLLSSTPCQK